MATSERYNGWINWATWNMALWLDNDYGLYCHWQKRARFHAIQPEGSEAEAVTDLAEDLEETCTPTPDMDPTDLLDVDWREVAEHLLAE